MNGDTDKKHETCKEIIVTETFIKINEKLYRLKPTRVCVLSDDEARRVKDGMPLYKVGDKWVYDPQ